MIDDILKYTQKKKITQFEGALRPIYELPKLGKKPMFGRTLVSHLVELQPKVHNASH